MTTAPIQDINQRNAEADFIVRAFVSIYGSEVIGPKIQDFLKNGLLATMEQEKYSGVDNLIKLYTEEAFRKEVVDSITDPIVKAWWNNVFPKTVNKDITDLLQDNIPDFFEFDYPRYVFGYFKGTIEHVLNDETISDSDKIIQLKELVNDIEL